MTAEPFLSLYEIKSTQTLYVLFSKVPFAIWQNLHKLRFYWKLILGASLKSLLLDFLIEVQTLEGEEQLCSHEEQTDWVWGCAAQRPQAIPPAMHTPLYWQQQDPAPRGGAKGTQYWIRRLGKEG